MKLLRGVPINEFSNDTRLLGNSDAAVPTEKAVKSYIDNLLIRSVAAFSMDIDIVPDGWLECNGQSLPRMETYAALFARIGVRFESGNGATTFNVPDLRGQFIRGWSPGMGFDPDRNLRFRRFGGAAGDSVGSYQGSTYQHHGHSFRGSRRSTERSLGNHRHSGIVRSYWTDSRLTASGHWYAAMMKGVTIRGDIEWVRADWRWIGFHWVNTNNTNLSHSHAYTPQGSISNSGGNETRSINASLMFCIKY